MPTLKDFMKELIGRVVLLCCSFLVAAIDFVLACIDKFVGL